jgi:hypothetical protein
VFYFGNQLLLAVLLAVQWLVSRHQRLLTEPDGRRKRREFELMISLQPLSFAVSIAVVFIAPGQAMMALAITQVLVRVGSRKLART